MVLFKHTMIRQIQNYGINISYLMVHQKENVKNIIKMDSQKQYVIIKIIKKKDNINHITKMVKNIIFKHKNLFSTNSFSKLEEIYNYKDGNKVD